MTSDNNFLTCRHPVEQSPQFILAPEGRDLSHHGPRNLFLRERAVPSRVVFLDQLNGNQGSAEQKPYETLALWTVEVRPGKTLLDAWEKPAKNTIMNSTAIQHCPAA
jgi:hypothetical protein